VQKRLGLGFLAISLVLGCSSNSGTTGTGGQSGATGGVNGEGGSSTGGAGPATGGAGGNAGSGAGGNGTGGTVVGTGGTGGASTGGTGGAKGGGGAGGKGGAGTGGKGGAGTGGSGTGGGTGGSGGAGGATTGDESVLERNHHPSRDGQYIQPAFTRSAVAKLAMETTFNATFTGNTWASPLYLQNGPGGHGAFFTVTNSNNVYALDETSGSILWTKSIGTAPGKSGQTCGDIQPIGIISTPVIDEQARTIYVAGAIGNTTTITAHQIHALSVDDGSERSGWPIDVSTIKAGSTTFVASPQNQRSALSLVNGILYVAYGGHNGDCGNYRGWVMAVDTANPTSRGAFVTGGTRGEAIWAAGGMASDGNGVFAVTGNNLAGTSTHADSEEVVRLTGLATVDRSTTKNIFYPTNWMSLDGADEDLSSSSPVYLPLPQPMVAATSKNGTLYLLDATNLGGMGGELAQLTIATGGSMIVHTALASYTTMMGTYVVFTTNSGAQCPSGMGSSGKVVMSVLVPAGSPPKPKVIWCVPTANASLGFPAAPAVTTTDGTNNAIVWFIDGTKLMGVDGDTGATLYAGADTCSGVHKWTAPIAVKGRIVVAGDTHLCAWSIP
jgi:hypothetical protein